MTLKQIAPSEVEMGMFIHSFQGNWLNHPFWRAKFLLADEDRLEAVRESALDGVIIDTERGKDIITKSSPTPTPPCAQAVRTPDRIVAPRPAAARFASAAPVFASAGKPVAPA